MRSPAQVEEVMHRLLGMDPRQRPRVEVHVFYGACGTGKTRRAMQMTGGAAYWAPARESVDKWRGYRGQADIVLDDFNGEVPLHDLVTLLIRRPTVYDRADARQRVIITSNTPPEKWYPDGDEAEFVGEMLRDLITSSGGVTRFEKNW